MFNYNPNANVDDSSCVPYIYGCTDPSALNYNPSANTEDFSCIPYVYGCMDSLALNFDPLANTDNGSCISIVMGCMDQSAYNFNANANIDDSLSCRYSAGCVTGDSIPYWLNDPCYAWVIDIDNYCCENEWDTVCQATYDYCEGTWVGWNDTKLFAITHAFEVRESGQAEDVQPDQSLFGFIKQRDLYLYTTLRCKSARAPKR